MLKLEHHAQLAAVGIAPQFCCFRSSAPALANGHKITALQHRGAHFLNVGMEIRTLGGDHLVRLLGNGVDDIQTEAAGALLHPPVHHIKQRLANLRIVPVQIRLLDGILVQIVLSAFFTPLPCAAAKHGLHLIGGCIPVTVPPYIPVVLGILPTLFCLDKPRMLVRSMVQHHIHQNLQITLVGFLQQQLHLLQRAEHGIDILIIGNVIAVVILRGFQHR